MKTREGQEFQRDIWTSFAKNKMTQVHLHEDLSSIMQNSRRKIWWLFSFSTWQLTVFCADPLVFHYVIVIKSPQDFNLFLQISDVISTTLWFQGLHSHLLSCIVTFWIISAEFNLAKVTLVLKEKEMLGNSQCNSQSSDRFFFLALVIQKTCIKLIMDRGYSSFEGQAEGKLWSPGLDLALKLVCTHLLLGGDTHIIPSDKLLSSSYSCFFRKTLLPQENSLVSMERVGQRAMLPRTTAARMGGSTMFLLPTVTA